MTRAKTRCAPEQIVIDALCRGVVPPRPATYAERVAAVRHLSGKYTDRQIGELIRRSTRTVLRYRTTHGIAGLPRGTNGLTRPNMYPLPPRNHRK